MINRLIILAGGASSRMKNSQAESVLDAEQIQQANQRSKGLIEVDDTGRSLLDYLLKNAQIAGYKIVYIITGKDSSMFRARYKHHAELKIKFAIQYIPEDRVKPLGTADAVYQTLEQYPELKKNQFSVCNSDNLYSVNALQSLLNIKSQNGCIAYDRDYLEFSIDRISKFAVMQFDHNYQLLNIIEKPDLEKVKNYRDVEGKIRVSMNIFTFDGSISFPFFKDCPIHPERNEKEIPTVISHMLKVNSKSMLGIPLAEHVPDLTSKEDIIKMSDYLRKNFNS
ncbi:NDP-sugar synthase [Winogradskyella sp. PG-2]|uniref:nucleotidyltransferase family protein n=1 Tax=Winogradskyella sp. PG-2 TaxID=754409 RepID=UPI00045869BC|nr:sugar phosphate nucleotidyltransferase [Winogradskyella sp. PG-2]BAO76864.1 glucose-1-phosphate thymidylyltransferase [Winogradskyella sp. PG-2]